MLSGRPVDAETMLPSLLQHRLAVAIVAVAVATTTGFFVVARPQYRPPHQASEVVLMPSNAGQATRGWTWRHGLPGFRIGEDMRAGNIWNVKWSTLSALRIAAPSSGVDPQSLRVLDAARLRMGERPYLLVAGRDTAGRTCIGAQPGPEEPQFFCPSRLAGHVAVMNVGAPDFGTGRWELLIDGVVSAAVTRVDVSSPATKWMPQVVFHRGYKTWGTFMSLAVQPVAWNARVDFYGAHGKLASLPLRFTHPGSYVFVR